MRRRLALLLVQSTATVALAIARRLRAWPRRIRTLRRTKTKRPRHTHAGRSAHRPHLRGQPAPGPRNPPRFSQRFSQGRRPARPSLRRGLRRNLHSRRRRRRPLRRHNQPHLRQAALPRKNPDPRTRALRQSHPRRPGPLRQAHRLVLRAQLCPHAQLERARPVLRHLRPLWRAQQNARCRVGRRSGQPLRRREQPISRADAHARLRPRYPDRAPDRLEREARRRPTRRHSRSSASNSSTTASATKSPPTSMKPARPKPAASKSSTAEPRRPRPPARSKFATSTRFSAPTHPNKSSRKRSSDLKQSRQPRTPMPAPGSASTLCSLKTASSPCAITRCR